MDSSFRVTLLVFLPVHQHNSIFLMSVLLVLPIAKLAEFLVALPVQLRSTLLHLLMLHACLPARLELTYLPLLALFVIRTAPVAWNCDQLHCLLWRITVEQHMPMS